MRSLVINPDPMTAKLIRFVLNEAGHDVILATSAAEALREIKRQEIDAVILELDLPDRDGTELCQEFRHHLYTGPFIFLTKRYQTPDKLRAFAHGADDVIVDPFDPAELVARVEAVTRRYKQADQQALGTLLRVGDAELSIAELTFRSPGRPPVLLTPTEMRILECLMRNSQVTISRETLIERTWGYEFVGESNRVDVYIRRLREKIEREPGRPEYIHTIRGIGYVFRAPARAGVFPLPETLKGPHSDSLASSAAFAS